MQIESSERGCFLLWVQLKLEEEEDRNKEEVAQVKVRVNLQLLNWVLRNGC